MKSAMMKRSLVLAVKAESRFMNTENESDSDGDLNELEKFRRSLNREFAL